MPLQQGPTTGRRRWWLPYLLVLVPFVLLLALSFRGLALAVAQERLETRRERQARLAAAAARLERTLSVELAALHAALAGLPEGSLRSVEPLQAVTAPDWAVAAFVRDRTGAVHPPCAVAASAVASGVEPPQSPALFRAEELEFARRPREALPVYQEAALATRSPELAAAALVGVVRCQRAIAEYRESVENAQRLARLFGDRISPSGIPYGLAAVELEIEALFGLASGALANRLLDLERELSCNRRGLDRETLDAHRIVAAQLVTRFQKDLSRRDRGLATRFDARVSFWRSGLAPDLAGLAAAWTPSLGGLSLRAPEYRIACAHEPRSGRSTFVVIHAPLLARTLSDSLEHGLSLDLRDGEPPTPGRPGRPKDELAVEVLPGYRLGLSGPGAGEPTGSLHVAAGTVGLLGLMVTIGLVLAAARTRAALALANDRSEFIARFSHELKTPLASIRLLTESVKAAGDGRLDVVAREVARLERLLGNVLAYSRDLFRDTLAPPALEPCDLDELVEDALELVRPTLGGRPIEWHPSEDPLVVDGDRDALVRVVLNVMANAARFGPEGRPIEVSSTGTPDRVELRVRDFGRGVAVEDRERIFEPFHRGARGPKTQAGMGLGLHLCRLILERHHGTITVHDPPDGPGAVFRVELPRRPEPR